MDLHARQERLVHLAEDQPAPGTVDQVHLLWLRDCVAAGHGRLAKLERRVLESRFGLCDEHRQLFKEIGSVVDVSGERVRQMQANAMRTLEACPARAERW